VLPLFFEMNRINYQNELEKTLTVVKDAVKKPQLLLHSCCAPCSSYVLEYLAAYFEITVLYYNPNIFPQEEYFFRRAEQERFIKELCEKRGFAQEIHFMPVDYRSEEFYTQIKGLESEPEGGARCFKCYELRLREAAQAAQEIGADYFTTTLSISPLKSAEKLNEIGSKLSAEFDIPYLYSDFKKKDGYARSVELSKEFNMYRQNYCGCVYSLRKEDRT